MAIVRQYTIGNCEVVIDDTYMIHDKNEIEKILKRVSEIYSRYFSEHPEHFERLNEKPPSRTKVKKGD